jgi:hypothetical protein
VRPPELVLGDFGDPHEQLRLVRPAGQVLVIELRERRGNPGESVHAVGYGLYLVSGEKDLRDIAVLFGYSVYVLAEVHGQDGHVELVFAAELFQNIDGEHISHDLFDELVGESVVAGSTGVCVVVAGP